MIAKGESNAIIYSCEPKSVTLTASDHAAESSDSATVAAEAAVAIAGMKEHTCWGRLGQLR